MKFAQFKSQVMSKWMVGYTKRKIINHARKHGLYDYLNDMFDVLGYYLSKDELAEFVKPEDRTKRVIRNGRIHSVKP